MPETFSNVGGETVLCAGRCKRCGRVQFPRPKRCAECGSRDVDGELLKSDGVVHACTQVHQARPGFPVPYWIGYVDFPGDVRVVGRLVTSGTPRPGEPVSVEVGLLRTDADGGEVHGFRFRLEGDA